MISGLLVALAVLVIAAGRRPRPRRDPGGTDTDTGNVPQHRRPRPWARSAGAPDAAAWARFLDAVAADLRGGTGLRAAATAALATHGLAGRVVRHPLPFERLGRAVVDDPDEAVVAQSLSTALQLGGATASAVQAGANLLRERAAVRAEARAHSAQARLSARVLTLVPIGFAAWSTFASATFRRALLTPVGLTSAMLGVVTNSVGWWWMRRIVHRATV